MEPVESSTLEVSVFAPPSWKMTDGFLMATTAVLVLDLSRSAKDLACGVRRVCG
jgi:predicted deacetylase